MKSLQITSFAQARALKEELSEHYTKANLPCCIHGVYFNTCPRGCTEPSPDDMESKESQQYGTMLERLLHEFMTRYQVSWEEIDSEMFEGASTDNKPEACNQ